jgi:hypothetical protein
MLGIRQGTGVLVAAIMVASCGDEGALDEAEMGVSALADGIVPPVAEVGCASAQTLGALATCIRDTMPDWGSEGYVPPSAGAREEMRGAVSRMLNGHCDFELGPTIAQVMRLRPFTDAENGKLYCVLHETGDVNGDGFVDRGWGTFIVDPTASRELSHQAPHPLADIDTEVQAIEMFKRTDARSFLLCGAHRNANTERACDGSYRKADCAHDTENMFFVASREIAEFYGNRPHTQIQWHGMGADFCEGVTAYISPGKSGMPPQASPVRKLDAEVEKANPAWSVKMPGSGTCALHAEDNVEGRLLNGVAADKACSAEAKSTSGTFVHIEQKREARDPNLWLTPVTEAFAIPDPTPPTSLRAATSPGLVSLSWVASNGANRYEVQRGMAPGGPYEPAATVTTTSWVDTNVVTRQRYFYVVTAMNPRGTSSPSKHVVARAR